MSNLFKQTMWNPWIAQTEKGNTYNIKIEEQ